MRPSSDVMVTSNVAFLPTPSPFICDTSMPSSVFKQETAYEFGLGIPAEPLFRSVNRCGRSRHLARKLSLRRKRSSPNVFEMAATETITSIILIKLIRVSLGTVRHPRRFKIVVIDIQITLKQMLRDFI